MARDGQVMAQRKCRRAWRQPSGALALFFLLLLWGGVAYAADPPPPVPPPTPQLLETDWRTGELEIKWSGVIPGNTIVLYVATHDQPSYHVYASWTADTATGSHVVQYLENGQTIWHYIVQTDAVTGLTSPPSAYGRQTPPITAFVINWPDMLRDLANAIAEANQSMQDHLDGLFTPSDAAMADLQDALNGLKQASGFGAAETAGGGLRDALDSSQAGMHPPAVIDDGVHTWTGGPTGGDLPDVEGGTATALTMRIPLFANPDGSLHYFTFFTEEQLSKFMWLAVLRKIVIAMMWIAFTIWLVVRFTPALKA